MTDQRRALLTEREREILSDNADVTSNYRYSVESRVRSRIRDKLKQDIDVLREHYPEIYDDLVYPAVCAAEPLHETPEKPGDDDESREPEPEPEAAPEPEPATAELPTEIDSRVWEVVDEIADGWADDGRFDNRRSAAAHVLQYALDTGEMVGKSHEVVDAARREFPVEGQNRKTYWRQNIRDALSEVGEYSRGKHGYSVESLE